MSHLLELITVWEMMRTLFWGVVIMVPLILCVVAMRLDDEGRSIAVDFYFLAALTQIGLLLSFYIGAIK